MTKDEFKSQSLTAEFERRGFKVNGNGMALCPFHEDKNPSVKIEERKGQWYCHACKFGGDIIRLIGKIESKTDGQVLNEHCGKTNGQYQPSKPIPSGPPQKDSQVDKIYPYLDAHGKEVYQVVRLIPKSFRQRHGSPGNWVWSMDRVERVLYRLPEVMKAEQVWIVEGEKDADNLAALGICATTNVAGAGKWLPAYSECLNGKDVAICPDNDKPGAEHAEKVFDSLAGKVATARIISIPKEHKDVSDYIASFKTQEEAATALHSIYNHATPFHKAIKMPLYFMHEIEPAYKQHVRDLANSSYNIGKWLPSLGRSVRALVPGELVLIIAETGVGKTAIISNIAMHAMPLKTIFFQLELPATLMYERLLSWQMKMPGSKIEEAYQYDDALGKQALEKHFNHLLICTQSKLSPAKISEFIIKSELKFGERPKLVLIDYAQLVGGPGKTRYEQMSDTAEEMKIVAKDTETIVILTSQVGRKKGEESSEINLYDGKGSGSLENSGGLVLGAWRDPKDASIMNIKVLKNTKGVPGKIVRCNYIGDQQRITEMSQVNDEDVPSSHYQDEN